jgi:ParB family transcriptional regulator, chromosome partitioning protein
LAAEAMSAMPVSAITVGERHRKDMGDLASLARSIRDIGLLHPVVVSQDGLLLAGGRRLEACKMLGWQDIPVTIVEVNDD